MKFDKYCFANYMVTKINLNDMTDEDMYGYLLGLHDSVYYNAVLRYNFIKGMELNDILDTCDPYKEPNRISKVQGIKIGLALLESGIEEELSRRERENNIKTNDVKK